MTFTPIESTVGGLLIGASVAAYAQFQGRISGMSGIMGGVIRGCSEACSLRQKSHHHPQTHQEEFKHKVLYCLGLVVAGCLSFFLGIAPANFMQLGLAWSKLTSFTTIVVMLISGLFVGFGTQLGSGCTSGHMICGVARLSKRSIVATMVFCGVAFVIIKFGGSAAFIASNIMDIPTDQPFMELPSMGRFFMLLSILVPLVGVYVAIVHLFNSNSLDEQTKQTLDFYLPFYNGFVFGCGLALSGMTNPMKVLGFFDIGGAFFDPSLMCVAVGAILPDMFFFQKFIIPRAASGATPYVAPKYHLPSSTDLDWKLITGAVLFGIGWGIGGVCPGPFLTNLGSFNPLFVIYGGGFIGGVFLKDYLL